MTATTPPEPSPDDIERTLDDIEDYLADQAPPPLPVLYGLGETKRVQRLRDEVAEAHLLAELQEDDTPFQLDTDKVRKRRRRTWEAARLHQLAQDPAALAYRDAKVRKVTTLMTLAAAGVALSISSIGVQDSVRKALGLEKYSAGWWAAYGVEAVLSLPLLAAVGVQAYSAIRGRVVDRKSPEGRRLFRTELVLLGLTLALNCWPAFTLPPDPLKLIVHSLGPVAAVLSVWVLPTIWKILSDLPTPWSGTPFGTPPVQGPYRENASDRYTLSTAPVQVLADHIRDMIARGSLPPNPGVHKIRKALGVGVEKATEVQKLLTGGA